MPFQLPELPYAKDALAPVMSAETLEYHWGKHHKAYVNKTNELIEGDQNLSGASLLQVVRKLAFQGWIEQLFDRDEEGVHVEMEDRSHPSYLAVSARGKPARSATVSISDQ